MDKIISFLEKSGIKPDNVELYYQAFTHPSFSNEKRFSKNYQRLEFLGDAILSKLSAERVFFKYSRLPEGDLTLIRSASVNGKTLAKFALDLEFDKLIRFGNTIEKLAKNDKILEDVFEAFVAAIYLDKGEEEVKNFLQSNVFQFIDDAKNQQIKNPKTVLQEYLQSESREAIKYNTIETTNGFESTVVHDGHTFGHGKGKTKKEAEVDAAAKSLELLGKVK